MLLYGKEIQTVPLSLSKDVCREEVRDEEVGETCFVWMSQKRSHKTEHSLHQHFLKVTRVSILQCLCIEFLIKHPVLGIVLLWCHKGELILVTTPKCWLCPLVPPCSCPFLNVYGQTIIGFSCEQRANYVIFLNKKDKYKKYENGYNCNL